MSGIYIHGMGMPKLVRIIEIHPDGLVCTRTGIKLGDAIPVPDHGRLIDADAFSAKMLEIVEQQKYDDSYAKSLSIGEILREVVHELRGEGLQGFENAPTVIEAEGVDG